MKKVFEEFALPFSPHKYQDEVCAEAVDHDRFGLWLDVGLGKCLGVDTPVIMYDGTVKMSQDIKPGDVLLGPDSTPRKVVNTNQGKEELFRVTSKKGTDFVCNAAHILNLRVVKRRMVDRKMTYDYSYENITVADFLKKPTNYQKDSKLWKPEGVDFLGSDTRVLPYDPYLVGVYLGDGTKGSVNITLGDKKKAVVDWLQGWASNHGYCFNKLGSKGRTPQYSLTTRGQNINPLLNFVTYSLLNKSSERQLPHNYKTASRGARLQLLAGLIDTDGHLVDKVYEITMKDKSFADDIKFIGESLGFYVSIREVEKGIKATGFKGKYWRLFISGHTDQIPCKIGYKVAGARKQAKSPTRATPTVEPIGVGNYYGFTLDNSDGLFLLGDFTVTHNTYISTLLGLYHSIHNDVHTLLFIVPPRLVHQWATWLSEITFADGDKLDIVAYQGTPAKRKKSSLDADCIVVSQNIFRGDYKRFTKELGTDRNVMVIYDEAHMGLRKLSNKIYKCVSTFTIGKKLLLLTATPIGNPSDTYAIVKLLDPTIYKRKKDFERKHVGDVDYFGNIISWRNLDKMHENLYAKAYKLEARDVLDMQPVIYSDVLYPLNDKHMEAYREMESQQYLETDDGDIINATQGTNMFHSLQRFVTAPGEMNVDRVQADLFDMCQMVYHEDDSKLIIYGNYRSTNTALLKIFNDKGIKAVGCWGDISQPQQVKNIEAFKKDPEVRVLIGNPISLGVGVDGLQHVCYRALFVELPLAPREFYQSVGRIGRQGQTRPCVVRCLLAESTIQVNLYYSLLNKDDLVNQIVKNNMRLFDLFKLNG